MDNILVILNENKHDPSSLVFRKNLYDYYAGHNYSNKCLEELECELKINYNILRSYIISYVNEVFNMSKEDFKSFKKEQIKNNKDTYIGTKNVVLFMYGIDTLFLWNNVEEKELFLSELYSYASKNEFDKDSLDKLAKKLNITSERINELIKMHKEHMVNVEINNKVVSKNKKAIIDKKRENNDALKPIYDQIIQSKTCEEIHNILDSTNYTYSDIKGCFRFYRKFYTKEQTEFFDLIIQAYKVYKKNKNKEKNAQKKAEQKNNELKIKLDEARKVIVSYLSITGMTFPGFLNKMNINQEAFDNYIDSIKENDTELYEKYLKLIDKKQEDERKSAINQINELGTKILVGFKDTNFRKFDILDYFYITDIPISNLEGVARTFGKSNKYNVIRNFARTYKGADKYNSSEYRLIFKETIRIGVETDKFGRVIEDSGRILTDEEKNKLVDYLNDNNIPINRFTYRAAFRRYVKGNLTLDNSKNNSKKLNLNKKDNC